MIFSVKTEKIETIPLAEHVARMAEQFKHIAELQALVLKLQDELHEKRVKIMKLQSSEKST